MDNDLWNFQSEKKFQCKVTMDNGYPLNDIYYAEWYSEYGFFRYENGIIKMYVYNQDNGSEKMLSSCEYVSSIYKIDFADAITALREVVDEYNKKSDAKDKEIVRFLELFSEFKAEGEVKKNEYQYNF